MIAFTNKDSSFFTVSSPDIAEDIQDMSDRVMRLTVNEEMGRLPNGTLQLYDPNMVYSRILRNGMTLIITWGYKKRDVSPQSNLLTQLNSEEVSGRIERRGLEVFISSPNGSANQDGTIIFNCNFASLGFRGDETARDFEQGTKTSVVNQLFDELGVSSSFRDIRFARGTERITDDTKIRQDKPTYLFLTQLSFEWRTLFRLGHTPKGEIAGIFIDPNYLEDTPFQKWTLDAGGSSNYLDYRGSVSNVISYTWKNNEGEKGVGDNVQIRFIDGQPQFLRFVQENEQVKTYRLVPERIRDELQARGLEGGIAGQTKLLKDWLSVKDFDEIRRFFEPIESSTAPQGFGYEISARMLGNPLLTPPNLATFGKGFPDMIGGSGTKWYIRKVDHTIDRSGYFCNVMVVDAFAISPTGEVIGTAFGTL